MAVTGSSMAPSLQNGDHLLVSRIAYRFGRPRRGEIVLLWPQRTGGRAVPECIKRVVGLPHERVVVRSGSVWVNDRRLEESYLTPGSAPLPPQSGEPPRWQLGADEYVVLGDNRARSTDSRAFGPIRLRDIRGRAWYRYAPRPRTGRLGR